MSRPLSKSIVLGLFCLSFVACSGQKAADPTSASGGAQAARGNGAGAAGAGGARGAGRRGGGGAVPVVTARAQTKSVPVTIPAVGTAEAMSTVQVRAQVTGQLAEVHFSE